MSAIDVPPQFNSPEAYLEYELSRVRERAVAFAAARDDLARYEQYCTLATRLLSSREQIVRVRRKGYAAGKRLPFDLLARRHELNPLEEEVLLTVLACHLSSVVREALIAAQGSVLKTELELGFLADLIQPPRGLLSTASWADATSNLLRHHLVTLDSPAGVSASEQILQVVRTPGYLAAAVQGRRPFDDRLAAFCDYLPQSDVELFDIVLPEPTQRKLDEFLRGFPQEGRAFRLGTRSWTVLVSGARRVGKTSLAKGLARAFGCPVFVAHLAAVGNPKGAEELLQLLAHNAAFAGAVLVLEYPEFLLKLEPSLVGTLAALVSRQPGLTVLEPYNTEELDETFEHLIDFSLELERTDSDERLQLWESLLPPEVKLGPEVNLGALAVTYELPGGQIRAAVEWARQQAETRGDERVRQDDLVSGAKSQIRAKLEHLSMTSRVKLTLDDVVLAAEPMGQLREFLDACRFRTHVMNEWGFGKRLVTGKGLIAMFTGEPGTGKTLSAEVMANELDLRLQIVSIPQIVSKWAGETEKNIQKIFAHARAQNSMLLFDEADALFGKRVKVEKSQDHFQNMEVNMLLQEVERFEGVVILTTNLEANLDRAFERRILFRIDFPSPEHRERKLIWQRLIPASAPIEGEIDYDFLAEHFEITGGQIKNALIRAAYRCRAAGTKLTGVALEKSAAQAAREAGKLTRPIQEFA